MKIDCFADKYEFLSNFYPCELVWEGRHYLNSEAAYQSAKCVDPKNRDKFTIMNPREAKRAGRHELLRIGWDKLKYGIMYEVCLAKFRQNRDLLEKLMATGDAELIEGNYWGDTYWGKCNGVGQNNLGKILMQIREEHKQKLF